ncbi:hypothetical protein [Paenibacillus sp. P36]|uniref:hypothetical protein n=1 Tax=Paenibacillus sp. P36 TaxID=3342538 RepID=UPI0038B24374
MKNPDPDDLRKQLESGPLERPGFTSKLQREIEEAVERKERTKPRIKPVLCFAGVGAIVAAILLFPWNTLHTQSDAAPVADTAITATTASLNLSPTPITTALLIGLRTEHEPANEPGRALKPMRYSTYRTMLIAPVRGQLQKTSEGSGILMPYKQNFWKIDSLVHRTKTDEFHYLSAHLADQPVKPEAFPDDESEQLNRTETLLFAGNQYVSIAEAEQTVRGGVPYQADRIWVRTLPQLKEGHTVQFYNKPVDKNHVSIADVYGTNTNISGVLASVSSSLRGEVSGESWTVQREPGHWVGKVAETPRVTTTAAVPDSYALHDFPRELPDKVVNHDDLCCNWNAIRSSWPQATDALTSPMNDMLVIFENGKLKFYPYGQAPGSDPQLVLNLLPGEQLVMAQWATDHYVEEWIDKVGRYLAPETDKRVPSIE